MMVQRKKVLGIPTAAAETTGVAMMEHLCIPGQLHHTNQIDTSWSRSHIPAVTVGYNSPQNIAPLNTSSYSADVLFSSKDPHQPLQFLQYHKN